MAMNTAPQYKDTSTGKLNDQKGLDGSSFVADTGIPGQSHNRYITKVAETQDSLGHMTWTEAEGVRAVRFKLLAGDGTPTLGDIVRVTFDASPVGDATDDTQAWNWLQTPSASELQTDGAFVVTDATATGSTNLGWGWAASAWDIDTTTAGKATSLSNDGVLTSDQTAVAGKRYTCTYTIAVATVASVTCGGTSLTGVTAGTYTETVEAASASALFEVTADNPHGGATIDTVSITSPDDLADTDVEYFELTYSTYAAGAQDQWSEWFQFSNPLRRADFHYPNGTAAADAKNVTIFAEVA